MFRMIKSKGCKRCRGDLFLERDEYGVYVSCIQCGAIYAERAERDIRRSNSRLLAEVVSGNREV